MNESIFTELLAALDMVTMERIKEGTFRILGAIPEWFTRLYRTAPAERDMFHIGGKSFFIENFLHDGELYWADHDIGRVRSGVWTEVDSSGQEIHLEASAVSLGQTKVLMIELAEAVHREKQHILQKGLEKSLHYERLAKVKEALKKSEEKYRTLVNNLMEGIWQEDNRGYATFVNPRFVELCGYRNEKEILGRHWSDFVSEEEVEKIEKETAKRAKGKRSAYESALKHKDGRCIPVMISTNPLQEHGNYIGSISAFTDITARRFLEEKLMNMAKNLEIQVEERTKELMRAQQHLAQSQKLAGLGQLAAGVSHELRNPLGIINTSFYYLKSAFTFDDATAHKHIRIIEEEVDRATKIVDNLLEFARRSPHEVEDIDINELLKKTLILLEKEFRANDVVVITNLLPVPKVKLHLDEMKQVLLNVMLNASQAMPHGGELSIETQSFRKSGKDECVRIFFHDTGVGIPEEMLSDIFNPFFTTKEKGVGLGLSLSYSIIQRFGGDITIESELGKGTVVTIVLPVA